MPRIGVFQYEKPLQSHTVNLVNSLVAAGYDVDLYLKDCPSDLVRESLLSVAHCIRDWSLPFCTGIDMLDRVVAKTVNALGFVLRSGRYSPLVPSVELMTRIGLKKQRYLCHIGIEKGGMIWASLAAAVTSSPFIYFSLELYDDDHPFYRGTRHFAQLRSAEKMAHRRARATIVQDPLRWEHLKAVNDVSTDVIYLPVSVPGKPLLRQTGYFYEKFGLAPATTLVLYLGIIEEERNCLDIARASAASTCPFTTVFHGFGTDAFIGKLQKEGGDRILVSTELVPDSLIPELVASASIGVCLYRDVCANDRLTAFSSEKIALYLQAGLPVIAFDNESYRMLISRFQCGVLVDRVSDMPLAVERILDNYQYYRDNAYSAFAHLYEYDRNFTHLTDYLKNIEHDY